MAEPTGPVRTRSRGQISGTLERYREAYQEQQPGRRARYVYDPEHKRELSKVVEKEAAGFKKVRWGELGMTLEGVDPEGVVRVADLVLMSVDLETWKALGRANLQAAKDQMTGVQRKYYDDIEQVAQAHKSEHHARPGASPIGSAAIAMKDFEYDVEQRSGEKG